MGRPRNKPESLVAVESGWWKDCDGTEYTFRAGETIVDSFHPLVIRGNPDWFKPVAPNLQRPAVEQMTAGPGELRGDE
jgi:hypothetical protein